MRKNMRGFTNYNESFLLVISSFEKKTNYFQKFMEKFKTKIVLKKEQSFSALNIICVNSFWEFFYKIARS
jgi:hypothetical protein